MRGRHPHPPSPHRGRSMASATILGNIFSIQDFRFEWNIWSCSSFSTSVFLEPNGIPYDWFQNKRKIVSAIVFNYFWKKTKYHFRECYSVPRNPQLSETVYSLFSRIVPIFLDHPIEWFVVCKMTDMPNCRHFHSTKCSDTKCIWSRASEANEVPISSHI